MRYPIQQQLLWPMLMLVGFGVAVTSFASAWFAAQTAREQADRHLTRLAATLADAGFPLAPNVLDQLGQLTETELVVLSDDGRVQATTLPAAVVNTSAATELFAHLSSNTNRNIKLADRSYRVIQFPIRGRTPPVTLCLFAPETTWSAVARQAMLPPLMAGLLTAGIAIAIAGWLARRFTTPIRILSKEAAHLAEGKFTPLPLPHTDDELRDLTSALNALAAQLAHYESEIRAGERLRTLSQLGSAFAHQLRNSLTGTRIALDLLQTEFPADAPPEALRVAGEQLQWMEAYLQRCLRLSRGDRPAFRPTSLRVITQEIADMLAPRAQHAQVQLTIAVPPLPEECTLDGDVDSLRQLLLNLAVNGLEAASENRRIRSITTNVASDFSLGPSADAPSDLTQSTSSEPARAELSIELVAAPESLSWRVTDTGPGIDPAVAPRLFEPFQTGKPEGTGLGLAVARAIAMEHHGTLQWERLNARTTFIATFPRGKQPSIVETPTRPQHA